MLLRSISYGVIPAGCARDHPSRRSRRRLWNALVPVWLTWVARLTEQVGDELEIDLNVKR